MSYTSPEYNEGYTDAKLSRPRKYAYSILHGEYRKGYNAWLGIVEDKDEYVKSSWEESCDGEKSSNIENEESSKTVEEDFSPSGGSFGGGGSTDDWSSDSSD